MKDTVLSHCLWAYQHGHLVLKTYPIVKRDTTFGNFMIDWIQRQIHILILLLPNEFLNFSYWMSESETCKFDSNSVHDEPVEEEK